MKFQYILSPKLNTSKLESDKDKTFTNRAIKLCFSQILKPCFFLWMIIRQRIYDAAEVVSKDPPDLLKAKLNTII